VPGVAVLHDDVFAFNVAEISQILLKRLDDQAWIVDVASSSDVTDTWNFIRLLRLGKMDVG
jgi:hypothetical protein